MAIENSSAKSGTKTKPSLAWLALAPSPVLFIGLICVFLGQRAFQHLATGGKVLSIVGLVLVIGSMILRTAMLAKAKGPRRSLEAIFCFCHGGVLLALLGYWLSTQGGMAALGISADAADKFSTGATVLWVIVLAISLVPLLVVETTIGISGRHSYALGSALSGGKAGSPDDVGGKDDRPKPGGPGSNIEIFRVREAALSGLSIALAASFLMVTCNVASERNIRKDVSYFKTSSPGTATENIVKTLDNALAITMFFPPANEVSEEVNTYFEALQQATGKVEISRYNRLTDSAIAKKFKASDDGTVIVGYGDNVEKFKVSTDIKTARRTQLRELDEKVQTALMKVVRNKKVVYLTVGHGELNQSGAARENVIGEPAGISIKATFLQKVLRGMNYEVKEYTGLGAPVPDDCDVLISLAPQSPFNDYELRAIDDYLKNGGAALFAFDPIGQAGLGLLEKRLGVRFDPVPLADDKDFARVQVGAASHQYIATNQFSSHAAITSASGLRSNRGILFYRSGSLESVATDGTPPKITYVVKSRGNTWRDLDRNWIFDGTAEKRKRYNIIAAIETAAPANADDNDAETENKKPENDMRVIVASDAELFSDWNIRPSMGARRDSPPQEIVTDAIKWLAGEEAFSGSVNNEKDVFIQHTKNEDAVWFYLTILGVPLLVLGLGLGYVFWRRRSKRRAN